uniref:Uncharacterized protein n=1 Tax=Amphimedon queenslandica TaxID=400682 RepID=A0A1X7UED9_AMPQE
MVVESHVYNSRLGVEGEGGPAFVEKA